MPPLPEIPNTYRISLGWSLESGVRPVNVFHVRAEGYNEADLAEALEETIEAVGNNPFAVLANVYGLETISVLPLDGASPTFVYTVVLTIAGGTSGEILPSSAGVLSISSTRRGPRGRGRMFIGPVGEQGAANGLIDGAKLAESVAGWAEVRSDLADLTSPIQLGVASYTHADFSASTGVHMRVQLGTQRRRQNQLL